MSTNFRSSFSVQLLQASKAYWEAHDPHTPNVFPGMDQLASIAWGPVLSRPYSLGLDMQFQQTFDSYDAGSSALPVARLVSALLTDHGGPLGAIDVTVALAALFPAGTIDGVHTLPPSIAPGIYVFDVLCVNNAIRIWINGAAALSGGSRDLCTLPEDYQTATSISARSNGVSTVGASGSWLLISGYANSLFWTNFDKTNERA